MTFLLTYIVIAFISSCIARIHSQKCNDFPDDAAADTLVILLGIFWPVHVIMGLAYLWLRAVAYCTKRFV